MIIYELRVRGKKAKIPILNPLSLTAFASLFVEINGVLLPQNVAIVLIAVHSLKPVKTCPFRVIKVLARGSVSCFLSTIAPGLT